MPFQSEKQRRYLWANEPEIARDWTDTYGSGIAKALGGRIGFYRGSDRHSDTDSSSSSSSSSGPGPGGQGATGQATQNPGSRGGPGPGGEGARGQAIQNPGITPTRSRIQDERQEDFRKKQIAILLAQQQAEKDYTSKGIMKVGPQLSFAPTRGPNIGNWVSGLAGSKIGGGLGSMLFGPWGMLLGSLFGRGVGQRAYAARQTQEEETLKQILMPALMQSYFNNQNKINEPSTGGEGIAGIPWWLRKRMV